MTSVLKKILIADDEPDLLNLISLRLKAAGYDVVTASSGDEALKMIKEQNPDLIILDVMMPSPNGYQVCRSLKSSGAWGMTPVVLLTAKATDQDKDWAYESGADDFIAKPYDPEHLITTVKKFLQK